MYIHESDNWPNFTWDVELIDAKLMIVNKAAGYLEGRLSIIGFDTQQRAAVEALTYNIVSSSEIEGIVLNSDQVRSSIARRMGVHITNEHEPSHYIEGVVEMMLDAVNNYSTPLSAERLFGWHHCLFPTGRSGMEQIRVGEYRVDSMDVVSGALGREKIHYHAPAADKVASEMQQFIDWYNADTTPKNYIKSAIAHFWFVSIHPFDDGNGRIGRAIADMALSQADNSTLRYFSISRQINIDKRRYNNILERCQRDTCDITAWIEWYLDCMLRAINSATEMLSSILNKAIFWQNNSQVTFNDRQKSILNTYLDGYSGKLTTKRWSKLANVSDDSASRDIKHLVDIGILIPQTSKKRNVNYSIVISKDVVITPGPNEEEEL